MLRPLITAAAFTLISSPLLALCSGPSYFDRLTPAEIAEIELFSNDLPYSHGTQWTATRGGDTLTLVGTLHIQDARLDAMMDTLRTDIKTTDLILLEATPIEEARLQSGIQSDPSMIFNTQGTTLPDLLDDATWTRLAQAAKARGVPAPLAAKLQPWYLSIMLALPPCALAEAAAGKRGLDHMIMDLATTSGIPMQALEPYDTLIKILQDGTPAEQIEMLTLAIMDEQDQISMFTAMRDSYFAQDIGSLLGLSHIAARHIPDLDADTATTLIQKSEDAVLNTRNIAWMPVIYDALNAHDDLFIGVGAAHLPGDQGLLNLLAQDGWTLTRR